MINYLRRALISRPLSRWLALLLILFMGGCTPAAAAVTLPPPDPATEAVARSPNVPVLVYYYIWFDPSSWERAKRDYPVLGRYASDDMAVMRQHIRWAKAAGITGFVVSWKSSDKLNRRLEKLITVAEQENFKLGIIYQGLDFARDPILLDKVVTDLAYFKETYAANPVFRLFAPPFARPLVIWSGTWGFTTEQIAEVTKLHGNQLLLLASERNLRGYQRLAKLVAGNAYYWSSVNPDTFPDYAGKLTQMGEAVHADHGLWIAPAAPGFDARMIEGTTIVERKAGGTLRRELATAYASSPDAVGLISWNEFSENSHIEPSQAYGTRYLEVLASALGLSAPNLHPPLLTAQHTPPVSLTYGLPLLIALLLLLVIGVIRIRRSTNRRSLISL